MRLHRPRTDLNNGCGAIALAATLWEPPETFYIPYGSTWGKRYTGMTTNGIYRALDDAGQGFTSRNYYCTKRLKAILPVTGRGIVLISHGRRHHAVAFNGRLVYDNGTEGRWMWVHDYCRDHWSVREVITFKEDVVA